MKQARRHRPWMAFLLGLAMVLPAQADEALARAMQAPSVAALEMNALGEQALDTGLQLIGRGGGLYPYALVLREGDESQLLGYQGDPADRPPEQEWSLALTQRLKTSAEEDDAMRAAALVRLHRVPSRQGEGTVPGLWVLLDHRDERPVILFLPFLAGENGGHTPGELIYYGAEQGFFPERP